MEAAGIEPASAELQPRPLHAQFPFGISPDPYPGNGESGPGQADQSLIARRQPRHALQSAFMAA